jgi:hypothetical protein
MVTVRRNAKFSRRADRDAWQTRNGGPVGCNDSFGQIS